MLPIRATKSWFSEVTPSLWHHKPRPSFPSDRVCVWLILTMVFQEMQDRRLSDVLFHIWSVFQFFCFYFHVVIILLDIRIITWPHLSSQEHCEHVTSSLLYCVLCDIIQGDADIQTINRSAILMSCGFICILYFLFVWCLHSWQERSEKST